MIWCSTLLLEYSTLPFFGTEGNSFEGNKDQKCLKITPLFNNTL